MLPEGHPFYSADNVLLAPHIAGSLGTELERLAAVAVEVEEALRHARGELQQQAARSGDPAHIARGRNADGGVAVRVELAAGERSMLGR